MKGFILAAGLGTRLKPWTTHHPKALVPVGGIPMLQRVITRMVDAGITDIVVNIHHFADQIIDFINNHGPFGANIYFSDERACLLDTGGAILKASPMLKNDTVIIHNADIYTDIDLKEIISYHLSHNNDATLLTSGRQSSRQLMFDNDNNLKAWINHNTGETIPREIENISELRPLSFNGVHVINPPVIEWIERHCHLNPFPIIPQYVAMSTELKIHGYTPNHDYTWFDIGKQETLQQAHQLVTQGHTRG